MGNFLLVAPEEWTQLDYTVLENSERGFSQSDVLRLSQIVALADEYFGVPLRALGMIPQNKTVLEAKLIETMYFYVRLD